MEQQFDITEEIPLPERQVWACSAERKVDGTPSQFRTTASIGRDCLESKKWLVQALLASLTYEIPAEKRVDLGASLSDKDHLTEFKCFSPDQRLVSKMDFQLDQCLEGERPVFLLRFNVVLFAGLPCSDSIQARLERELHQLTTVYGFVLS